MRHEAAVRAFHSNFGALGNDRIACGRSDGTISIWDMRFMTKIDEIMPDLNW